MFRVFLKLWIESFDRYNEYLGLVNYIIFSISQQGFTFTTRIEIIQKAKFLNFKKITQKAWGLGLKGIM